MDRWINQDDVEAYLGSEVFNSFMSAPADSLIKDLDPQERKHLQELKGDFWWEGPNDINYKMNVKNNGIYLFNVKSTPLGVKLYYKGCVEKKGVKKTLNRNAPILSSVVSEIKDKTLLDVGNLSGVRVENKVYDTDF